MTMIPDPRVAVLWTASAEEVRNAPPIRADPPPVSDGALFVPAGITVSYAPVGSLRRSASWWGCVEVVLHRRDGDKVTTRTFTRADVNGLPGWAEEFVMVNHPYRLG